MEEKKQQEKRRRGPKPKYHTKEERIKGKAANSKKWHEQNKERVREYAREYYQNVVKKKKIPKPASAMPSPESSAIETGQLKTLEENVALHEKEIQDIKEIICDLAADLKKLKSKIMWG